jgi:hypothetical protein
MFVVSIILIVLFNLLVLGLLAAVIGYVVHERREVQAERSLKDWLRGVCAAAEAATEKSRAA